MGRQTLCSSRDDDACLSWPRGTGTEAKWVMGLGRQALSILPRNRLIDALELRRARLAMASSQHRRMDPWPSGKCGAVLLEMLTPILCVHHAEVK